MAQSIIYNRKNKVLILGAGGMAGHVIYTYLKEKGDYDVIGTVFSNKLEKENIILDVRNVNHLVKLFNQEKPDFVINCIGALVKESNENPSNSIFLNAYLPRLIEHVLSNTKTRIIHISTDCVFSGEKGGYTEQDQPDAQDVYGRGKALGEIDNDKDLTLRTSIIGPEIKSNGQGLFHWYMSQKSAVRGFTKAYWGGVTTLELATVIHHVIQHKTVGLLQVTNNKKISKFHLLNLIKEIFRVDVHQIDAYDGYEVDKSLSSSKFKAIYTIPDYDIMLKNMYDFMVSHQELYSEYLNLGYFKSVTN